MHHYVNVALKRFYEYQILLNQKENDFMSVQIHQGKKVKKVVDVIFFVGQQFVGNQL